MDPADAEAKLSWDDSFAIARALIRLHPEADLENVSLRKIYEWTLALPEFDDDPVLVNDSMLTSIYQEWFEEKNPL